jgi:NADPH:quinone reductase-like Zn-dependent oxidoreductase
MTSNRAVVNAVVGEGSVVAVSVPKLRDDYIIVKTKAVGLNPTDWKHIQFLTEAGARIGCGMHTPPHRQTLTDHV